MEKRFYYSIASGSKGNCALYLCDDTAILIDLGVSVRRLQQALRGIGMEIADLTAVLFTHAHSDHIKGVATFLKKYNTPFYATHGTADELCTKVGMARDRIACFWGEAQFAVGDIAVQSFLTPHDASESVGYILTAGEVSLGFATDLGFVPKAAAKKLVGCDTVVLESNHDLGMLEAGPYPWPLKERVRGRQGHLSNPDCAALAVSLARQGTQSIVLAHLSETNNTPHLALKQTQQALHTEGIFSCDVVVAPKDAMQKPVYLPVRAEAQVCCL